MHLFSSYAYHRFRNTEKSEEKCLSNKFVSVQANGLLGNLMCEYAHLKTFQIKYSAEVIFSVSLKNIWITLKFDFLIDKNLI